MYVYRESDRQYNVHNGSPSDYESSWMFCVVMGAICLAWTIMAKKYGSCWGAPGEVQIFTPMVAGVVGYVSARRIPAMFVVWTLCLFVCPIIWVVSSVMYVQN